MPDKVAYLINQYPKISHTFIRREILALEKQGVEVLRIAIRGWDLPLVDPADITERKRTRYVLREGLLPICWATLLVLMCRPVPFFRALVLAIKCGIGGERPLPYHLVYLAEACVVHRWVSNAGIAHLHAHFSTNSAETAMLASTIGGCTYSFTAHGTLETDAPRAIKLTEKIKRAAFVVAVSSFGRAQLLRWSNSEQWHKCKVVHCGLDLEEFGSISKNAPDGHTLVCVGRYCKEKGQLLLLGALRRVMDDGHQVKLVLAGDGEMRPEIEAEVSRLNLGNSVELTGWIDSDEVKSHLLKARALVVSSFSEGLPIVIMEAMALERPVVGTYVAGIPELVVPGTTGWLVAAGNEQGLADAVKDCLGQPNDVLADMGQNSGARVSGRHDIDESARRLAALFRSIAHAHQD